MSTDKTKQNAHFIRLVRAKVENSHYAAYQIEKIIVSATNKVIKRERLGQPDMLEMTLAKITEALDPESVVAMDPSQAVAV